MILSHGALLSPETTVLSPRVTSRRVACGHYTPPHPPPTRRRGWRVHPSTARHHPWPRQRRAPRVPPTPFRCVPPPHIYFLSHYTIQNPTAYGTRSHSITTHIHTLSTVHVLVLVHAYTLRAAVCAPAAPGPPRQFLACMLQGGRQYAWYVWEDYITAHNETRVE
jgi:hypothetical protein